MKKIVLLFAIVFLGSSLLTAQTAKDKESVVNAINWQVRAWNKGDIPSFMQTYWPNDSLMFIGKNGVTYGWQSTLDNYKKSYPDTAAMGKLSLTILQIKPLSPLYFFVVGQWHLTRSMGNLAGHFTLLFKKIKNKWLIVADHSS